MKKRILILLGSGLFILLVLISSLYFFSFRLNGKSRVEVLYQENYQDLGYKANIFWISFKNLVKIENNVNTNKIGTYKVIYKFPFKTLVREVKVVDKEAPIITLKGNNKIIIKEDEPYEESGYTAIDNVDLDITSLVKVEKNIDLSKIGTYSILYSVSDSSGNYTEVVRTVEVIEKSDITYIKGILLVNKKYHLPADYNPGVNSEAKNALTNLQNDASLNGYSLPLLSGFRSYNDQKYLFNSYVSRNGYEKANTFSARPGESEHQTGLAFDVGEISDNFGNTKAGIWLSENAHKYGFIIRYLKGKEDITGYKYEPWHIRYVGVDAATKIKEQGITLEEYLGV